jgi:hypothetical protein
MKAKDKYRNEWAPVIKKAEVLSELQSQGVSEEILIFIKPLVLSGRF